MLKGLRFPLTFSELLYWVNLYTGRKVKERALRHWFSWCRVHQPRGFYEWTDLAKLVVFGQCLNRFRSYELAQQKLIEAVESDYHFFFPSAENTINAEAKTP